ATGASIGTGLSMDNFPASILVAKTLPTRVGNGPFPSEMWERQAAMDFAKERLDLFSKGEAKDEFLKQGLEKINSGSASPAEMSQYFQVLGDERGATTGRGRSIGYLDIPWLQYAIRINGPKYIALTRFDMLSGLKSIPVVVGYKHRGEILPPGKLPAAWELGAVEVIKEDWPCFTENIFGTDDFAKLPQAAQSFINNLEKHLGVKILLVGTGPGREAMIVKD
ncbi:MAG TPA: adenylosuccinate synthetase, partial [Candidatus Limnocylindria bacterium]|nr:adenylosuccinate synthetase [Candidatus Limnocylindria bacterium]